MAKTLAQLKAQLDSYSTQALPPMISARRLALKTTRKPEKIEVLARAILDEANTRAAFEKLPPEPKMLLRLLREAGGGCTIAALKIAAGAVGLANFNEHLGQLMSAALVLYSEPTRVRHELWNASVAAYNSWSADPQYPIEIVETAIPLADDSIELPPPAHILEAYAAEPYLIEEQSPAALLHVLFNVVKWASEREITLTKTTGTLRKADLKALDNQLKDQVELKEFAIALALGGGLLLQKRESITPNAQASEFFARAPREQIERLFRAWLALENWSEFFRIPEIETDQQIIPRASAEDYGWASYSSDIPTAQALAQARAYLIGILKRAGGQSSGQWQSLASLQKLVEAENPDFLMPRKPLRSASYYRSNARHEQYEGFWPRGEVRWRGGFNRDTDWNLVEGRFLRQMLAEPLSWLGIVAIARDKNGEVAAFRLSPLGAHLLGLSDQAPVTETAVETEKPLIVQPNFEIIAYTEAQHLRVLYELERFATRERAERVAHYKIDRDSVYRGFQDGLNAAQMREFLKAHSRSGVPQNIAYSLDDWQLLWERVTMRPSSTLIEADSEAEMDAFVGTLPADATTRLAPLWALIEARYLEAARKNLAATKNARAFDYGLEIEQAFETTDDLKIIVPAANLDLWLESKLEQFSENRGDGHYEITRESVARARELGLKSSEILTFLATTGAPPVAANVALTVRGWSGEVQPVALEQVQIVAAEPEVLAQMASISQVRALLWLRAGEGAALVKAADVPKLQAELQKRGIAWDAAPATLLGAPKAQPDERVPPRKRPATRGVEVSSGVGRKIKPVKVAAHPDEDDVELQSGLAPDAIKKLVRGAIKESRNLVIEYQSKARLALRKVSPLEVFTEGGNSYLNAWDFWRNDGRIFRVDRITRIAVTDETFDPDEFE